MAQSCSRRRARPWKARLEQRKLFSTETLSPVILSSVILSPVILSSVILSPVILSSVTLSGALSIRSANGQTQSKDPYLPPALVVGRIVSMRQR